MYLKNLVRRIGGNRESLAAAKTGRVITTRARRLRVEPLEERTLLSVGAGLDGPPNGEISLALSPRLSNIDADLATVVGTDLAELSALYADVGGQIERVSLPTDSLARLSGDRVVVEVIAAGDLSAAVKEYQAIGMDVMGTVGRVVCGWLPVGAIDDLGGLSSVAYARPPAIARSVGSVDSQGDVAQLSDELRSLLDYDGTGITVGVISDSYDTWDDAEDDADDNVASGDLPNGIDVLEDYDIPQGSASGDEGRAMLQIIHDVAPGADLAFHTAWPAMSEFVEAIEELADPMNGGADIIVDDVIYYTEPMFMDGVIAQAVDEAVSDGVAYFSAAGNYADASYESAFDDSDVTYTINGQPQDAHDFDPTGGQDLFQEFTLAPRTSITLSFQWDEPFASLTGGDPSCSNDMNIFVVNQAQNTVLAQSITDNVDNDPLEFVSYQNPSFIQTRTYNLLITQVSGGDPGLMKYVDFGNANFTEYQTNSPTLFGHANTVGAMAVGAAFYQDTPEFETTPPEPEDFTALGGVEILFDTDGDEQDPEDRLKPDVVGPDGANTTFFLGNDVESDGDPNFFGTSAAAPHVAAIAALMLQAVPSATPEEIYDALESTAVHMADGGYDYLTGHGLVHAVDALLYLTDGVLTINGDRDSSGQNDTLVFDENSTDTSLIDVTLNDTLLGSVKKASLTTIEAYGLGGHDTISLDSAVAIPLHAFGGAGNDSLKGGAGDDCLYGGAGGDSLEGGGGNDYLSGGTGQDRYHFAGEEELGHDTIAEWSEPNDSYDCLFFMYLEYAVSLNLASTQQQEVATNLDLTLLDGNAIEDVYGTDFNDILRGNDRDNMLIANDGNDSVSGRSGDDYIQGYGGNDHLVGGYGDDEIYGGEGDDFLAGGYGLDILWGQGGDDYAIVYDGEGGDTAYGGSGYDVAMGDYGDYLDAEEEYYGEGGRGGESAGDDPVILTAEDAWLEELIYGGLQDPKTLQQWRELLWFYLEWQKKRTSPV